MAAYLQTLANPRDFMPPKDVARWRCEECGIKSSEAEVWFIADQMRHHNRERHSDG